jgi:hypothetical protein
MANQIDIRKALATIKVGMPTLTFPIANAQSLLKQLGNKSFTDPVTGKPIQASAGVKHIPAKRFPISTGSDFDTKISTLIAHRATKKGFEPINFTPPKVK